MINLYKIKFASVVNIREGQDRMCQIQQLLWRISVVYWSIQLLSQAI